jgi:hypothetical protein
MSERPDRTARRLKLCKAVCALFLAAGAAACDKCGDFVPPIRFLSDQQPEVCRDQAPQPR